MKEFTNCVKGLKIKVTNQQVQWLFNHVDSIEEQEDEDDDDIEGQVVELLGDVSQYKTTMGRLIPAADLRQLFVPKAGAAKRGQPVTARRTHSLATPTSSRRSARGDSSTRTVTSLEDTRAEAALRLERLIADVNNLVSVVEHYGKSESPSAGHSNKDGHRDLQRMRGNFSLTLGTILRQILIEYTSEVTSIKGGGHGRSNFLANVSQAVSCLDKAAAKVKTDRPYGFPRSTPTIPQGAQRESVLSLCRSSILEKLTAMSASADLQRASQVLTAFGTNPLLLDEFKILVLDETASRILSRYCSIVDLVNAGICMVEDIRNPRLPYTALEAVYCISPSVESIQLICDDFPHNGPEEEEEEDAEEDTMYKAAHVILVGTPPRALLSKLKHSLGTMLGSLQQQTYMDFIADSDASFELDMAAELQDASLEDIESAPHHQETMANKLSQVCVRLGITRPVIRWHNASAPPENDRVYHPTLGEARAARACSEVAELTHKRLLDVHCEHVIDEAKEEMMQEQMDALLDKLRGVVVRREGIIRRRRDAGSTEHLFELMELNESTVRRKFGIHYAEDSDYKFKFISDPDLQDPEPRRFQVNVVEDDAAPPNFCEVQITDLTTTEEWELHYRKRPLDWGIAGSRDAGVHMYDFRLWRRDAGLAARKSKLVRLDQAAQDLEKQVKELELKQHRPAEAEHTVVDMMENEHMSQLNAAKAAGHAFSRPSGRYQPDLTTGVLILHRLVDLIAPLIHDTTYEAACADSFEERTLLGMSQGALLELFQCRQTQKAPKPGKKPKAGWLDAIDEEAARGMVLDCLRTTADWHKVRNKDLFDPQGSYNLGEAIEEIGKDSKDSITSAELSTSPVSADVVARDLCVHHAVLHALRDSCERRNLLTVAKWETEMIRAATKGGKQERRSGPGESSGSNRALWEKAKDSDEFDIPALRRLLSNKVTDVNDKARVALIFILMRWNKQKTENPSRGDVWKSFVIDEANRQGRFFNHDAHAHGHSSIEDASSHHQHRHHPSYADELEHKYEFTSFYTKKQYKEMLMVEGTGLPELGCKRLDCVDECPFAEWTERGRVLSCNDLQQLRDRAYVAATGTNFDPSQPKYVRDAYEARQYDAAVETKWSVFVKKLEKAERMREDQDDPASVLPFRWEDGSEFLLAELPRELENFIDFEGRLEHGNTQQQRRQYKDEMKSYLSERQEEPISVAIQNTMKILLTTSQEGDQWSRISPERKAAEYAKFKRFELHFEAYYAWMCRDKLPADTVLGDAWIQKLLNSLQIPLQKVYEAARTLDSPVEREYGYKAKKARKQRSGTQSKRSTQLQPTICGVARHFVEGKLSEESFPRTKSQAMPKDHSSQKGAKGTVTHTSKPLDRLVVFIIGGASPWEARMIKKLSDELKCEIVIGSNETARPQRVMELFHVAPRNRGVKQAEATGDASRLKKFPIKKKEVYHMFDQYAQGRGKNRTMSRQAVEQAVTELSSKLKIKHRSALARALKVAEKTPVDGGGSGVNKHEFRILVDNISQIDDLMREFDIADSDHRYRFTETDFRKAACVLAHDFIGGAKIRTQESDRAFRKLQIEGYVLFDEFIDWMVSERKLRENGRHKKKLVHDSSPAITERRLSPSRRPGSPTRRSPTPDSTPGAGGRMGGGFGHWRTPVPEPEPEPEFEFGDRRDDTGRTRVQWATPEPEPEPELELEPEPEPEFGEWREYADSGRPRGVAGRNYREDGTGDRERVSRQSSGSRESPVMRAPTAEQADAARRTRQRQRSSGRCCARPMNID
eukprot:COSAG02_NODE_692_length_18432_cov_12.452681_5_plen_1775_part_00